MTVTDWVSVEHAPPQWIPRDGALSVNRYADVAALLRHPDIRGPELGRNITKLAERANRSFPNLVNLVGGFLLFQNPPVHTRRRQFLRQALELLGPALTEATIRGHANFLLDSVDVDAPVDATKALSNRLPIRVMAHALGVSEEFVAAARETNYGLHRVWHYGAPLRAFDRLEVEAGELLAPLIEKLQTGDGSASGLQAIGALGKDQFDLAANEIAALVFFLVLAGTVTTSGMLGSAMLLALLHPSGTWWRGTPQTVKSGFDEVLRMAPPLREVVRVAAADVQLDDAVIQKGTSLVLKIEEAHRDPAAYEEAAGFDPTRRGLPHLGFAAGAHACIGVALAYREGAVLLEQLFSRFSVELLDTVLDWDEHRDFRRLKRLSVSLSLSSNGKAI